MREGLTQLEEFRYQWPDLKAQWGSMRSCRQESLSLYGSTLLFSQENLCCCNDGVKYLQTMCLIRAWYPKPGTSKLPLAAGVLSLGLRKMQTCGKAASRRPFPPFLFVAGCLPDLWSGYLNSADLWNEIIQEAESL